MEKFEVNILGCGSAIPTRRYMTTSQLVNVHEELFMVDCGEGAQIEIWSRGLKVSRLNHIFISHMHGDHFFGLLPFLSSLGLMANRTEGLHLYVPQAMEEPLKRDLLTYCALPYEVIFHAVDTETPAVLFENEWMQVESIPLKHKIPCCGFLFREKQKPNVLLPERCQAYGVPVREYRNIKNGADFVQSDGMVVPNSALTKPSDFVPRSYAFCSDTAFCPEMIPQIKGATLLYHEATYLETEVDLAEINGHSTARQAAETARLAEVKQLLIGHYSIRYDGEAPLVEEARQVFPATVGSTKGMVIAVE